MGRKKNQKKVKSIIVNIDSFSQIIKLDSKENIIDRNDLDKLLKMKAKFKKIRRNLKKTKKSSKDSNIVTKSNDNSSQNIFQLGEKEMQEFFCELKKESSLFL